MKKSVKIEKGDQLIVDPETGEITNTFGYGDRIIHKEQLEYLNKNIVNFNKGENFVKVFDKAIELLTDKLTNVEFAIAMKIIPFISYNDNILRLKNKKMMDVFDLAKELNINYDTIRKTMTSLFKKGILSVNKTGCIDNENIIIKCIVANPYIYMRGNTINKEMAGLFQKTGWDTLYYKK